MNMNATAAAPPLTKEEANVIAPAALAGVRVSPIEDDRGARVYVVSRWSLTKACNTLHDVRELLVHMGIDLPVATA